MSVSSSGKSLKEYKYYDSPEGCDIDKKALVLAKYAAVAGIILSTKDVLMYSHASGWLPIMKRYAYHTLPLVLMGTTFATVSNHAVNLRQKNDPLNYFLGGLACGPILAYYLGSYHAVLLGGAALGVAGAIKKDGVDKGFTFFPVIQSHMRTVRHWRNDHTLAKDPKDVTPASCAPQTKSSCVIV